VTEAYLRAEAERRIGRVIKGKYRVESILGMGGMAVVYAVTHVRNRAALAIKMLHPTLSADAEIRRRFLREGYTSNSVGHANVVMIVDDDTTEDGAAFIVMERLRGASLEAIAKAPLSIRAVLTAADQMLDVLAAAHTKGIIHRDIKPANVFVTHDGTVKVLDFGIARVRDLAVDARVTITGEIMGTPAFMAPEQASARRDGVDARTDVWAVGATMFTLLSGELVHRADSAPQMLVAASTRPARSLGVVTNAPRDLVALVDRALAFNRADRFASATEMRSAVRELHRALFDGESPSRDVLAELVPAVSPGASAAAGDTTMIPMSSDATGRRLRSLRSIYVAVVCVIAGAGVLAVWRMSKNRNVAAPPVVVATAASSPAPTLASPPPPTDSAAHASLPLATSSAPIPSAKAPTRAHGITPPAKNCDPPFRFDAKGNKVFLPECM
jgi:serine/threonine-protein kinase